ncbi:MAG: hypothetical protein JO146_08015 [Candidatus Eremiobacteraeota bacterium]|nr:hypothetical protein [Candidatus Eremiobacteraeota bacterium]
MTATIAVTVTLVAAVVIELIMPGRAAYHAGWYNVAIAALAIVGLISGRRLIRRTPDRLVKFAVTALIAGGAIVALAGVASGLLAPDDQTFTGAPGQRLRVESLGILVFPLASGDGATSAAVTLERPLQRTVTIGARPYYAGNFVLRAMPRDVAYVEARDLRGNRLTVTQPTGSVFLSPVLLMEHRQTIAGLDLPYDSFSVPAAQRVVKAVMFTAAQAAMLLRGGAALGEPAVLFAVDDENQRPVANAIALSAGGRAVRAGGLILRGEVVTYPAVAVAATPNLVATIFGALLALGGLIGATVSWWTRHSAPPRQSLERS